MEITCANEEAYLNELVAYRLQFEGYTYDQFTNKLVEVHVIVFKKNSPMQVVNVTMSSRKELVVIIIVELELIRGGVALNT